MQNLTEQGEIGVPGCQICLVKPSCKCRLQLPNAGFFLTPDPLTCIQESSDVVRILPTPLLRPLFEGLKDLEDVIPPELMGDVHQNLLSHLKLNLAGLPDRRITEEMLAAVVQPFMQEVEEVHTTISKKLERRYFAVWGHFDDSGAVIIVRLGPKNGETICNEEVHGTI